MRKAIPLLFTIAGAAAGPCDLYTAANTPCVAAHSMVRALYNAYGGALYRVQRASDNSSTDIPLLAAGGVVNAAVQDVFCAATFCEVTRIYDQSPKGNHLDKAPAGGYVPTPDKGVNASRHPVRVGGHPAYGAQFEGGMGYRLDHTNGVATGDNPETLYMVVDGSVYNGGCCFDYGNAETDNHNDGSATMEAVYWGNSKGFGHGAGDGPWVLADLENGLFAGNVTYNPNNPSMVGSRFVTAMVKGGSGSFGLRGGDAQTGALRNLYQGPRPAGYNPMKKQGSIILGIGGDNCDFAVGVFYEGVITVGVAPDSVDAAVHADIQAAGYAA